MNVKREQKSKNSVLIDLFYEDESAEKNQISLYNALHEKPLPDGAKIMPLRVENIIYMNFQNDFSYEADGKAPLELEVKVININPGAEHELLEKCQVMKEYGLFK